MDGIDLTLFLDAGRLGAALRICRMLRGMGVAELSSAASMDKDYLISVENGEREPSLSCFVRLADAMGVTPALLLAAVKLE